MIIDGYPTNIDCIVSEEGYGKTLYPLSMPIVVVTAQVMVSLQPA